MKNRNGSINLGIFTINLFENNGLQKGLQEILEIDCDMLENEEYFREDTLKLGFKNEAERVVKDFIESKGGEEKVFEFINSEEPPVRLEELIGELIELNPSFLLANCSYCSGYEFNVHETSDDDEFLVSIAYGN